MTTTNLILLPGMHGTSDLFGPLRDALGALNPRITIDCISYPTHEARDYQTLADQLISRLRPDKRNVLIAESFSGPVAILAAAQQPAHIAGLVLVATFSRSPPRGAATLTRVVGPWLFGRAPPEVVVRHLLAGRSSPPALVRAIHQAIQQNSPDVLADRLQSVLGVNVDSALQGCAVPMLALHATQDRLLGERSIRHIARLRPDIPISRVEGPHLILQTMPTSAAREIMLFTHRILPTTDLS